MEWFKAQGAELWHWVFIAVLVVILLSIGLIHRRKRQIIVDGLVDLIDWFEMRGLGTVFDLIVLAGIVLMALVGWRIPAEIENTIAGQTTSFELFPLTATSLSRFAQIFGAVVMGWVAMRSIQYVVPIMSFLAICVGIYWSYSYIVGV